MTTSYSTRTIPSTSYSITRLGGAYLVNTLGEYILTMDGERIVLIVPGGDLQNTAYNTRIIP